jgi:RimJ/RimL family protein N-acetyltransferase
MNTAFEGEMVKLTAENPDVFARGMVHWGMDTEYMRFLDSEPPRMFSEKKIKEWFEKDLEKDDPEGFFFAIKLKELDRVIGFMGLFNLEWSHGDGLVAIAIGEREHWGKGYGTEAMQIMLRYAFNELNLRRVTLIVFDYNKRAQRSYEKAGFVVEGRMRSMMQREGQRWDMLCMGVLKEEWGCSRR